jgi:hypothetical protein
MILWRLSDGASGELVCEVEKHTGRYRLVVKRGDEVLVDEAHHAIDEARTTAEVFRKKLESMGTLVAGETALTTVVREPAWRRTVIEIYEVQWTYDIEDWNRWSQGDRSGFPPDPRLA